MASPSTNAGIFPPSIDPPSELRASKADLPALHIRRILLCTDFSATSHAALQAAVRLWKRTQAHITVLHVCEFGPIAATTDDAFLEVEKLYANEERQLRAVIDELRSLGVRADPLTVDGNAPAVILEVVERLGFDIVILGTRATRGVERIVFGSTAEGVLRRASCPVLTIGAQAGPLEIEAPGSPIIFATDFHENTTDSLKYAIGMANLYETPLHCLHVLPPRGARQEDPVATSIISEGLNRLTQNGALCRVPPVSAVLYGNDIPQTIVEYATAHNAQAIVIGVRRKSRIASHLPPQRIFRILMMAHCPVLTVSGQPQNAVSVAAACGAF